MKNILMLCLLFAGFAQLFAAKTDTVSVKSNSMNKEIRVVTIVPDAASAGKRFPVIYLLHGYAGNHQTWTKIKPDLQQIAERENVIFVCPDGWVSWYWDSPKNPAVRYETFISSELVDYADKNLPTLPQREKRAITGLSMGGHGALWNGIRHKDVFGAAGSTSGGVDIRPFPKSWRMAEQLGTLEQNPELWDQHTVINQISTLQDGELALVIDCGFDDFFREVNSNLHEELLERKIAHDYLVRPGGHNHKYWNNSIDYQILFFTKYFGRQ